MTGHLRRERPKFGKRTLNSIRRSFREREREGESQQPRRNKKNILGFMFIFVCVCVCVCVCPKFGKRTLNSTPWLSLSISVSIILQKMSEWQDLLQKMRHRPDSSQSTVLKEPTSPRIVTSKKYSKHTWIRPIVLSMFIHKVPIFTSSSPFHCPNSPQNTSSRGSIKKPWKQYLGSLKNP